MLASFWRVWGSGFKVLSLGPICFGHRVYDFGVGLQDCVLVLGSVNTYLD